MTHRAEQDRVFRHFIERSKLGNLQKAFLYGAVVVLWVSGAVWLWLRDPVALKVHGAAAMAFLLVLGSLISIHVRRGWVLKRNRFSGAFLIGCCGVLTISGWMLYYAGNERLRAVTSILHWVLGLSLPALIYLHILAWRREQRRSQLG